MDQLIVAVINDVLRSADRTVLPTVDRQSSVLCNTAVSSTCETCVNGLRDSHSREKGF